MAVREMNDSIDIIDWFRASTTYINAHRGKTFVVFVSGEALADPNLHNIVYDLSLLNSLGVKLVLVHGARPQISAALARNGRESSYHKNLRITEADCMQTIKATVGALSLELESMFAMGISGSPMHGANINYCRGNFVTSRPVGVVDGVDFQYTGKVRKVHSNRINQQLDAGNIVLISNLGNSVTGELFNLSAEEIATEVAAALQAEKLILLIPSAGVMDDAGKLVASLQEQQAREYVQTLRARGDEESVCVAQALEASLTAYARNVHRCHLISFKENGAMLRELFTRQGHGSLMSKDSLDQLRNATIEDVGGILSLIKPLEEAGTLVERSRELLETEISNFKVIELEETIIACAALYPIGEHHGEVACIAIHPQFQKNGLGDRLLISLEKTAKSSGIQSLFVLTTVASHFFLERGFTEVSVEDLPEQRQQLYNYQRRSKVFRKTLA